MRSQRFTTRADAVCAATAPLGHPVLKRLKEIVPPKGVAHCGAGCTLGDIIGEWLVFTIGWTIPIFGYFAANELVPMFIADFTFAWLLGIGFQYFAIVPMREEIGRLEGIWEAIKADTLSIVAFQAGLFAFMAFYHLVARERLADPQGDQGGDVAASPRLPLSPDPHLLAKDRRQGLGVLDARFDPGVDTASRAQALARAPAHVHLRADAALGGQAYARPADGGPDLLARHPAGGQAESAREPPVEPEPLHEAARALPVDGRASSEALVQHAP